MFEVEKDGETEEIPMLRYYRVFHIDDIEGISEDKIPEAPNHENDFDPIASCEQLIEFWHDSPEIRLNRNKACYIPTLDEVYMPNPKSFSSSEAYFSCIFHELVHSTGHRKRLSRHEKFSNLNFGSKDYSVEELVAEMGAAYLCGICGIENATIDSSAAYIQGWLKKLKNDNKIIVSASGMGKKAVDYILEHQDTNINPKPKLVRKKRKKKVESMSLAFI